jgi:translocator protein
MTRRNQFRSLLIGVVCLAAVAAAAWFGAQFRPGAWYAALDKPPWTPPNWVFGPVWTVLYVFVAVAGWLIFTRVRTGLAGGLWIVQLGLNAAWSWLFFGLQRPALALADIVLLLAVIVALLIHLAPRQRAAFWLLLPYAVWVGYALSLNAAIALANP